MKRGARRKARSFCASAACGKGMRQQARRASGTPAPAGRVPRNSPRGERTSGTSWSMRPTAATSGAGAARWTGVRVVEDADPYWLLRVPRFRGAVNMHRARLTRQAQNSHPSCRGRRPRRPVNSIKNSASGGIFTLSRGAERPNCDRPRSGHLSGRTRAPKASGRGGRGRNVGASVPAQKRFSLGLHPVSLGKTKEMGWNGRVKYKYSATYRRVPPRPHAGLRAAGAVR